MSMTKEELLTVLQECANNADVEEGHIDADKALIRFIDDPDIKAAFERVHKWYA